MDSMSTSMDIIFCVDYTSSMTIYFDRIRAMIIDICSILLQTQGSVHIGLIKFRSIYDVWTTNVHGFTQLINTFQQWLNSDQPDGISPDGYEAVGDALNEALNIEWPNKNEIFNEKLVILFTDGAPNGLFTPLFGADPWVTSNRFFNEHITLVVVGVGESVIECDDFYCALAENTGGQYIPMVNFERIFLNLINLVFNEGDTVNQVFRHLSIEEIEENSSFRYEPMRDRVNGMIKKCQAMFDIRRLFFSHRSSFLKTFSFSLLLYILIFGSFQYSHFHFF